MELALKRPWLGLLLVFFWAGVAHSETGETYGSQLKTDPKATTHPPDGPEGQQDFGWNVKNGREEQGMKETKPKDLKPPEISRKSVLSRNQQKPVILTLTVGGKSYIDENIEITVISERGNNMIKMTKHPTKYIRMEKRGGELHLLSYKTNLPNNFSKKFKKKLKFLKSTLEKLLPGMDAVVSRAMIAIYNVSEMAERIRRQEEDPTKTYV